MIKELVYLTIIQILYHQIIIVTVKMFIHFHVTIILIVII